MSAVDDFITIARQEIGYTETGINLTKYNEWADDRAVWFTKVQGLAWCSTFVAWCVNRLSEQYTVELEDFCLDDKCCWSDHWMANFMKAGRFFPAPQFGDLAFKNGHIAIVETVNPKAELVTVIEGNSHNSVERTTYPWKYWLGFGRPKWTLMLRFPTDNTEETSAKEFVINQGIYIGKADGEMHWGDNITREEMALILYRYWKKFNK